jgi:hypothetical protein
MSSDRKFHRAKIQLDLLSSEQLLYHSVADLMRAVENGVVIRLPGENLYSDVDAKQAAKLLKDADISPEVVGLTKDGADLNSVLGLDWHIVGSPAECNWVAFAGLVDGDTLQIRVRPIDYDDEVGEDDDKRYVYGFNGEVGLGSYDTPYEAMVAAESALKRMAKAISAEFKKVRL